MTCSPDMMLSLKFETPVIPWRGPSPYFFAPLPLDQGAEIKRVSNLVTYRWGVIPVEAEIAGAVFGTSLFPRDGTYLLRLKDAVRRKKGIAAGDGVAVSMGIAARKGDQS